MVSGSKRPGVSSHNSGGEAVCRCSALDLLAPTGRAHRAYSHRTENKTADGNTSISENALEQSLRSMRLTARLVACVINFTHLHQHIYMNPCECDDILDGGMTMTCHDLLDSQDPDRPTGDKTIHPAKLGCLVLSFVLSFCDGLDLLRSCSEISVTFSSKPAIAWRNCGPSRFVSVAPLQCVPFCRVRFVAQWLKKIGSSRPHIPRTPNINDALSQSLLVLRAG